MIVEITSWTPRQALSSPGTSPHSAPASAPPAMAATRWSRPGSETSAPIAPAASPPMTNWPSTPMLNRPAWNATATARPASSSGVADTSVSAIGRWPPRLPLSSAEYASIGSDPAT